MLHWLSGPTICPLIFQNVLVRLLPSLGLLGLVATMASGQGSPDSLVGRYSYVGVEPRAIVADGISEAMLSIYWENVAGNPMTEQADQVSVRLRGEGQGVYVGPVVEVGNGYYEVAITATRPGSTYAIVTLGGVELPTAPAIFFRSTSGEGVAPVVQRSREQVDYVPAKGPVLVDEALDILGLEGTLERFRVAIVDGALPGDELGFLIDGTFVTTYDADGIVGGYVADERSLVLEGAASVSAYVTALRKVAFRNPTAEPGPDEQPRTIAFTLLPPGVTYNSETGTFYEFVSTPLTWQEAYETAARRTLYGLSGYLATITSDRENDVVQRVAAGNEAWIGASNDGWYSPQPHRGAFRWRWTTGPETGTQFGYKHTILDGHYANWSPPAPRGASRAHVYMTKGGGWVDDDVPPSGKEGRRGFVVEYGGLPGNAAKLTEYVRVNIVAKVPEPPVAFSYEPARPRFGEPVHFVAREIRVGSAYTWNFGDGTPDVQGREQVHTFATPGNYRVYLTVVDGLGRTGWTQDVVQVGADMVGYVYHDENGNGRLDGAEGGIGLADLGVAVMQNGMLVAMAPDPGAGHTFDERTGRYYIASLLPGRYEVMLVHRAEPDKPYVPPGWLLLDQGTSLPVRSIALSFLQPVDVGTVQGPDFGLVPGFVVRGTVFQDDGGTGATANDGRRGTGERGISGMRLRAVLAGGHVVDSTLTDVEGRYTLRFPADESGAAVRLVLNQGTSYRPTGYTPGTASEPVRLSAFVEQVDVPVSFAGVDGWQEGYDIGLVPGMQGSSPAGGTVSRGGVRTVPFTVTLGTVGRLRFTVDSPRGWQYAVYHDANGNGLVDTSDALLTDQSEPLGPGPIALLLTVRAPSEEVEGAADTARLVATLRYAGNEDLQETLVFYVMTGVRSERLDLAVSVRNVTADYPAGPGSYTTSPVEAATGDVLEYRVTYENRGTVSVSDVTVWAAIPYGTRLVEDAYGPGAPARWHRHGKADVAYPAVTRAGRTFSVYVGTVLPEEHGSFTYQVILD